MSEAQPSPEIQSSVTQLPPADSQQKAGIKDKIRSFVGIKSRTPEANSFAAEAAGLPVPLKKAQQPGENSELHPEDRQIMEERAAEQAKHNDIVARATLSGLPTSHPVEPHQPIVRRESTPTIPPTDPK